MCRCRLTPSHKYFKWSSKLSVAEVLLQYSLTKRCSQWTRWPATAMLLLPTHFLWEVSQSRWQPLSETRSPFQIGAANFCTSLIPLLTISQHCGSTNSSLLHISRFSTEFGNRLFSYFAPTVWNGHVNIKTFAYFRHLQTPSENSPFQISINILTMLPS